MSAVDPQLAREIARTALRRGIRQCRDVAVAAAVYDSSPVALSESVFYAYRDAVGAEYDRLAAVMWPDEPAQAERDADTRAVEALLAADTEDALPTEWVVARSMLRTRFADRIAELREREKAGE